MRWNERVERVPKKKNWYICTHGVIKPPCRKFTTKLLFYVQVKKKEYVIKRRPGNI